MAGHARSPEIEVDLVDGHVVIERSRGTAPVPVTLGTETVLLDQARIQLATDGTRAVVANAGGRGFFRVRYPRAAFTPILAEFTELAPVDQTVVLRDVWACLRAGRATTTTDWLALVSRLFGATAAPTWTLVADQLATVDSMVRGPAGTGFVDWLASCLRNAVSTAPSRQRATLLVLLGVICADPSTVEWARAARHEDTEPAFADAVVAVVAAHGGEREHAEFRHAMHTARSPQERLRYSYGLARFRDPELATETVAVAVHELPPPATAILLGRLLSNRWVNDRAWAAVEGSWTVLTDRLPPMGMAKLLAGAASLGAGGSARRVEEFLGDHAVGRHREVVRQGVESLRSAGSFARRLTRELPDSLRTLGEPPDHQYSRWKVSAR